MAFGRKKKGRELPELIYKEIYSEHERTNEGNTDFVENNAILVDSPPTPPEK